MAQVSENSAGERAQTEREQAERLQTERLELFPLPPAAAAALPDNREEVARIIAANRSPEWPQPDLLDVLPRQAAGAPEDARFGAWVIVERASNTVIGDIGFFGPPTPEATVEIGYSIVPDRRRRGYLTEAASALIDWAKRQPGVSAVLARCDPDNLASIRTLQGLGFSQTGQVDQFLAWRV